MRTVSVKVNHDHLERVARAKRPVLAIAELVWNGLDADATDVHVRIESNPLGGVDEIRVSDNGHGLPHGEAPRAFENLGGSWKRTAERSRTLGRTLHGKAGRGRFHAFALGAAVEWATAYDDGGGRVLGYTVRGNAGQMSSFAIEDPAPTDAGRPPGTTVTIRDIRAELPSLLTPGVAEGLTEQLALYLMQYTDVTVRLNGVALDPMSAVAEMREIPLSPVTLKSGEVAEGDLTVVEWKSSVSRTLVLCDEAGFPLHEVTPGVQAPGFHFTAYLKSRHVRTLSDENALLLESLDPDVQLLLDNAKSRLRQHFRVRSAEQAKSLVQEWVEEDTYPYSGPPADVVEEVERQVFDVLALNVNSYLPDFARADPRSRRLSFRLLKQAVEQNATAVLRILQEVLDLPKDKQEELANLLQKTSLTAMINASREVTDRLDFLKALEHLVFDPTSKAALLERRQLHRVLARETWVFGEEYRLSVDDQSLRQVLEKHVALLGKRTDDGPVVLPNGGQGIVDLMLSRFIPQQRVQEREHLIIELKRPSQKIDDDVANQVRKYAFAVAEDERFADTKTRWHFVAVSNEITPSVRRQANQRDKPAGLLHDDAEQSVSVWVKTWGQILEEARGRLHLFQERLNYQATENDGILYLKRTHQKYLPDHLQDGGTAPSVP